MKNIYLDHNATTPIRPEVFEAMVPFLKEEWGNPSSIHWAGRGARKAMDDAREEVAAFLNCKAMEVIFTSSGTESDNHAIKGAALANLDKGNHIITTKVEHPAVLNTCKHLEKQGFNVTYLGVGPDGRLDLNELKSAITDKTTLMSIMHANNETGVIFPISEIAAIARERKVVLHTDAVQAAGKIPLDVQKLGADLVSISGHKFYGPKGTGVLYAKKGVRLVPILHGGHHERNRRGGTENVAGIVGLAKAATLALKEMDAESKRLKAMRDRLEKGLLEKVPHSKLNGHKEERMPNTSNISFEFVEGEGLLLNLDMLGVATSSGSACTSGSLEPSHVLIAMGLTHEMSHGSVRFSFGKANVDSDVDYMLEEMPKIVARMRAMSPLYNVETGGAAKITYSDKCPT